MELKARQMNKRFFNPSRHMVHLAGPNKETVTIRGGSHKILSDFYLKYCPKYILVAEEEPVPQERKQSSNVDLSHIIKSSRDGRKYVHIQQPSPRQAQQVRRKRPNQAPEKQTKTAQTKTAQTKTIAQPKSHMKPHKPQKQVVGRTIQHAEATKLFKKHLEINKISISNDIGVGILSYNRLDSIKRLLDSIKANTNLNKTTIFVSDESSDIKVKEYLRSIDWIILLDNDVRLGIAGNSNRLLRCLNRFKYKILLNDDVTVNKPDWDTFYITAMQKLQFHHFCYRQVGVYGATDGFESTISNGYRIKTIRDKPHGAIMVFDATAFEKVGFFDTGFGMYGMEHVDWSYRVGKSGIQPSGYHDIDGSEAYFTINADISACEHRTAFLTEAKSYYEKVKNTRIRVEPDDKSVVPSVTYVVPYRDQDGRTAVFTIINNIKAQKFPNIELILVEQAQIQTIGQLSQFKNLFIPSNGPFNKAKAFNAGVVASTNDILILHDADIMATDNYTLEVYNILQKFKSCHIGKNVIYVDKTGTDAVLQTGSINIDSINCDRVVGYFEGGSLACYKDEYIRIGGFNEVFDGYGCEDCEFFERMKNNTNMYDERYVDFIHLNHGRSTGWEILHTKNVEAHKRLINIPMHTRLESLRNEFMSKYK